MAQPFSQVLADDQQIKMHARRAQEQLEAALMIARRSVRGNPRARSIELDLARLLRGLEDLGTLASKYPVEEPAKTPSPVERHRLLRDARQQRAEARQQKVEDLVDGQDLVEEND